MKSVRTRFAPSPTGALHLGAVRTALFAWLFARHSDGQFILRIEDTDQTREVAGATDVIKETLGWLGLNWDEGPDMGGDFGPYIQSERLDIYRKYTDVLLETGKAYRCWCSPERLDGLRKEAQAQKVAFKYDRHCLTNPGDVNQPHVVRFKVPDDIEVMEWHDLVKGGLSVALRDVDDFVALKSDGFPTYHLASVIDDHLMEISHVIRSDEWLPSTPKHLLLYKAFDWETPFFAHVPNVLGEDGRAKLSKRRGAKAVLEYRDAGYLQSALINMMATLGWNDGTEQEVYSVEELIQKFSLERVQKSAAVLDERRLLWLDGAHIRELSLDELFERSRSFMPESANNYDETYQKQVIGLIQERLKFLAEIPELTNFFFSEPTPNMALITDNKQLKKLDKAERISLLEQAVTSFEASDFSASDLTNRLNELLEQTGQKPGILFSLIRVATTWAPASPGLADSLAVLGKDTSLERLQKSLDVIANS